MFSRTICVLLVALGLAAQERRISASIVQQDFQISGTVLDALSGSPLARTKVTIIFTGRRDLFRTVTAGEDGRFLFKTVVPGKYMLVAGHRGFPQQALNQHGFYSTAIAVGPGKESENLVFRMTPESSISGRVVDEQGDSVRGGQVMLFERGAEDGEHKVRLRQQTGVDDRGSYSFGHLTSGTYFVAVLARPWYAQYNQRTPESASEAGSVPQIKEAAPQRSDEDASLDVAYPVTYYAEAKGPDGATPIILHPGDNFTANMALMAVPALHLRVTNVKSDESQNLQANLMQPMLGGFESSVQTETNLVGPGVLEISGVPPGRYDVNLQTFDPKTGTLLSSRRQAMDVSDDGELDGADGSVSASVTGIVKFEGAGGPPRQASIQFQNSNSVEEFGSPLSATGDFDHVLLAPGRYRVSVPNSEGFRVKGVSAIGAKVGGQTVEIIGSGPVQLTLVASKATGRVDGVVVRDGKPVAGAMVVLVPQDAENNLPRFRRDQSDSDGTFTLPAAVPGKYTVLAIENGWDLDWANPAVLKPYMAKGEIVQVAPNGKSNISVRLQ